MSDEKGKNNISWGEFLFYTLIIIFGIISLDILIFEKSLLVKTAGGFLTLLFVVLPVWSVISDKIKQLNKKTRLTNTFFTSDIEKFLGKELVGLICDSYNLSYEVDYGDKYSDYSFVVFPYAKAFEGFLKKILYKHKLIKKNDLIGDPNISIAKYFHPEEGIFYKKFKLIKRYKAIPSLIYSVYQECRNDILHFDLWDNKKIIYSISVDHMITRIEETIDSAYIALVLGVTKIKANKVEKLISSNKRT